MDVLWFLNKRLDFAVQFYETAAAPFRERLRQIEAEEPPYVPPYSEDGEPPYLAEWIEAHDSLQTLAYSCVSMISAAIHLYFRTWERESGRRIDRKDESLMAVFSKRGYLYGYAAHFMACGGLVFESSPANLGVLEEVILVRHRIQHPEYIGQNLPNYSSSDLKKLGHPFFLNPREEKLMVEAEAAERGWLIPPTVYVTTEKLHAAIDEVRKFAAWFEEQATARFFPA